MGGDSKAFELDRLRLELSEERIRHMFLTITPENAAASNEAVSKTEFIDSEFREWYLEAIAIITREPKPLPMNESLLVDLRKEILAIISDCRKLAATLSYNVDSSDELIRMGNDLLSKAVENYAPYQTFDERKEEVIAITIFQLRMRSYRNRDPRIVSDILEAIAKSFQSVRERIEDRIEDFAAKERIRRIAAEMKDRAKPEIPDPYETRLRVDFNSHRRDECKGTVWLDDIPHVITLDRCIWLEGLRQEKGSQVGISAIRKKFDPELASFLTTDDPGKLYRHLPEELKQIIGPGEQRNKGYSMHL